MTEPTLEADEIQASIAPGFDRDQQLLVAVTCNVPAQLVAILKLVTGRITSLADAMPRRLAKKASLLARTDAELEDPLWVSASLGARALTALGYQSIVNIEPAFKDGMWKTLGTGVVSRVGDPTAAILPTGTADPSYPPNWQLGGSHPIDVLIIFASDSDAKAAAKDTVDAIIAVVGSANVAQQLGALLPDKKEHFGFVDGISVPGFYGLYQSDSGLIPVTTRYGVPSSNGVDYGRPGQPLCWPGQFILGYPTGPGGAAPANIPADARNGSFLVFRRLNQDVGSFYADTRVLAAELATNLPNPDLNENRCRALIIGRWPGGEPVMRAPSAAPAVAEPFLALNYFQFGTDLPPLNLSDGTAVPGMSGDPSCPFGGQVLPSWSHIRKTNPRDLGTDLPRTTRSLQMLRRGIPFGPLYDHANPGNPVNAEERGLLFLSFQTSIQDTFETIMNDWLNNPLAPPPGKGADLVVGLVNAGGSSKIITTVTPDGQDFATTVSKQWVIPTGGAYLFTPSIALLKKLST